MQPSPSRRPPPCRLEWVIWIFVFGAVGRGVKADAITPHSVKTARTANFLETFDFCFQRLPAAVSRSSNPANTLCFGVHRFIAVPNSSRGGVCQRGCLRLDRPIA